MTTDSNRSDSGLDDEVTLAASDRAVQELKAEAQREQGDFSVWTGEHEPAESPASSLDPGIAEEPTIIRGFGDEPTTPLVKPAAPVKPGSSLIDGLEPPHSDTTFFDSEDLAPDAFVGPAATERRRAKFPLGLLILGVLLVAATITIVLAVLLGSASL